VPPLTVLLGQVLHAANLVGEAYQELPLMRAICLLDIHMQSRPMQQQPCSDPCWSRLTSWGADSRRLLRRPSRLAAAQAQLDRTLLLRSVSRAQQPT
jgi:hypothetical protein